MRLRPRLAKSGYRHGVLFCTHRVHVSPWEHLACHSMCSPLSVTADRAYPPPYLGSPWLPDKQHRRPRGAQRRPACSAAHQSCPDQSSSRAPWRRWPAAGAGRRPVRMGTRWARSRAAGRRKTDQCPLARRRWARASARPASGRGPQRRPVGSRAGSCRGGGTCSVESIGWAGLVPLRREASASHSRAPSGETGRRGRGWWSGEGLVKVLMDRGTELAIEVDEADEGACCGVECTASVGLRKRSTLRSALRQAPLYPRQDYSASV